MAIKGLCSSKTRRNSMRVSLIQTAFFLSYLVRNDAFLVLPPSPAFLGTLARNGLGPAPITLLFSSKESTKNEIVEDDEEEEEDEIPSMDWLTNSLESKDSEMAKESTSSSATDNEENGLAFDFSKMLSNKRSKDINERQYYMEEHSQSTDDLGDVPIPTTGISVADEMAAAQKDRFTTELVPIQKGLGDRGVRAAQIVTFSQLGSFEPVRYLIQLDKVVQKLPTSENEQENQGVDSANNNKKKKKRSKKESTELPPQSAEASTSSSSSFVMVDIPPFSEQLASDIRTYMGSQGQLLAMLVTHRDGIHYSEARAVYTTRRADLQQWANAFPNLEIVAYRLDIPRDCRESVTQILDGYGPFALDNNNEQQQHAELNSHDDNNVSFIETGRPLTYAEWDHDVTQDIMTRGYTPPDDAATDPGDDDELYTPQAIRAREEGKRVLALYTPGATFGSLTYVFPNVGLCCSGLTIPVEDNRSEENPGISQAGPVLDCRGYITTSKAGITRQMESARQLVNSYCDRFNVVLPSRGDPLFLDGTAEERREELLEILDDYDRIGKIYEQLGITSFDDDD
jgi:hypothetical protein